MMRGGDFARFATSTAKYHILQMSQVVPLTIVPRGNKDADVLEGSRQIAEKLTTKPEDFKEYITVVYDKIVQRNGTCKCILDIQTDAPTGDAIKVWEPYLIKANVKLAVVTEKKETKEDLRKALWFSGVQPRQCNKAIVRQNLEKFLSEKGKEMPVEVIECYHALPIDVTENGVVSQQKISTKVLAVKTRKEDVNVLVGTVSKLINHDKTNIFNDPSDLVGIVNPHPIVHAIPFRANNRYQHLLLSKHKEYMDTHKVPFFIHENVDRVIPADRLHNYIKDYANLTPADNTLRRIIMSLTNTQGNQAAEAIYATQREDFIITCLQENSKVIADYCALHSLEYKNMWEKFDPNYESDMTKSMKEIVAAIEVEEKGYYIAPGRRIEAAQIAPSAWKKKPTIATDTTTPVAIRADLKRTEDMIANSMQQVIEQMTASHQEQMSLIREQHEYTLKDMTKKYEELLTHHNQQGEMLDGLLQRNDNDQQQLTEGFEKMTMGFEANEEAVGTMFQNMVKMQETSSKDSHMVVKAMQQNMDTTAKSFRIITEELNTLHNEVEFMSKQSEEMEAAFDDTAKQVNTIFDSFVLQRGEQNRLKRDRSRSVSSRSTSGVGKARRFRKRQQREQEKADVEFDNVSVVGKSDSDDDTRMSNLTEGNEDEDLDEGSLDTASDDTKTVDDDESSPMDASGSPQEAPPLVSGSPQGLGSRRD